MMGPHTVTTASRTLGVGAALCGALLTLAPGSAQGQIRVGGHGAYAQDAFDGATGIGVRAGLDLPALPFAAFASAEKFFPDCPPELSGCSLSGFSLEANFELAVPVIQPYATAGIAWRDYSAGGTDGSDTGLALGAGVSVGLGGFTAFGEGRYEFMKAPERQYVFRLGLLLGAL